MTQRLDRCHNLHDFEREAEAVLPRPIFGYVHGAAEDRLAFDGNYRSFRKHRLVPRVLVDATSRSPATELMGQACSQPFGMAHLAAWRCYRAHYRRG